MTENKHPPIEDDEKLMEIIAKKIILKNRKGSYEDWIKNICDCLKEYTTKLKPQADRGSDADAAAESEDLEIYKSYVYWDCRDALQELVDLKEMKQYPEHKEEYERRKPIAWEIAKKVLAETKPQPIKEDTHVGDGLIKELGEAITCLQDEIGLSPHSWIIKAIDKSMELLSPKNKVKEDTTFDVKQKLAEYFGYKSFSEMDTREQSTANWILDQNK